MSKRIIKCAHDYLLDKNIWDMTLGQIIDYMHSNGNYYDIIVDECGLYNRQPDEIKNKYKNEKPLEICVADDSTLYVRFHRRSGEYNRSKGGWHYG